MRSHYKRGKRVTNLCLQSNDCFTSELDRRRKCQQNRTMHLTKLLCITYLHALNKKAIDNSVACVDVIFDHLIRLKEQRTVHTASYDVRYGNNSNAI